MRTNFVKVTVIDTNGDQYLSTVPRSATKPQILRVTSAFYGVRMVAIAEPDMLLANGKAGVFARRPMSRARGIPH
jgi:hypothetical protein